MRALTEFKAGDKIQHKKIKNRVAEVIGIFQMDEKDIGYRVKEDGAVWCLQFAWASEWKVVT